MKLDAVAAYSAQPELNKPVTATQTAQSTAVAKNFEEDVVNLSGVSAGSEQPEHNGHGKHPPEGGLQIQLNGNGKHPPEITLKAQSNGANLELPQPDHNGFGKHPPEITLKAQSNGANLELPQPDHNGFGKHPPE